MIDTVNNSQRYSFYSSAMSFGSSLWCHYIGWHLLRKIKRFLLHIFLLFSIAVHSYSSQEFSLNLFRLTPFILIGILNQMKHIKLFSYIFFRKQVSYSVKESRLKTIVLITYCLLVNFASRNKVRMRNRMNLLEWWITASSNDDASSNNILSC